MQSFLAIKLDVKSTISYIHSFSEALLNIFSYSITSNSISPSQSIQVYHAEKNRLLSNKHAMMHLDEFLSVHSSESIAMQVTIMQNN